MNFISASLLLALIVIFCLAIQNGEYILIFNFIFKSLRINFVLANSQGIAILSGDRDSGGAILTRDSGFAGAGAIAG